MATRGTIHEPAQSEIQRVLLAEKSEKKRPGKMVDEYVVVVGQWGTIHGHVQFCILTEKSSESEELSMLGFAQPVGKPVTIFELAQLSIQMRQRKGFEEWQCWGPDLVVSAEVQATMLELVRKLISFAEKIQFPSKHWVHWM